MADTKWSSFPSATPGNSDEVVGLHSGDNARFSIANIVAAVRQGLASIFVPLTRTINGKGLSTDISLDSSDIDYDNTQSGLTATDVQEAIDELAQGGGGGGGSAANVTYDNTTSGLTATDVQDAIDEVVADLGGKQSTITASGILLGDGAGGVTAATAGTDYATPAQLADKANQSQLAYVESGTTASRDYLWDEFFWMGGTLYRTTNRVNNGTPFTVGTNCEAVSSGGFNKMAMRLLGATVGAETIQPPSYQCLVLATRNTGAYLGLLYTITTTTWYLIRIHNGISDISLNTRSGAITFPSYTQYVYFW